jgi:eukaryotic-like serine/threonine-protein kinase
MKPSTSPLSDPPTSATDPPGSPRGWLATGELVAGKYRLERKLGKGAMGSVWVATHLALETPVAIKFMTWSAPPEGETKEPQDPPVGSSDPGADRRARFEREAKAAAQIRSANVVQVFDYGVDRGVPFIVMELLEGEDLNKRLQREGRLTPTATASLVQAIARALQRAHDVGLVHRDLKPGNIFLAKEGDHEVPKVVDFGVVKTLRGVHKLASEEGSENTVEGTLIGTPSYMSPEQAMAREDVDHRSDLWSFGVILFQTLTGMKPFPGGQLFEALIRICSDPIPHASAIAPDLPSGVDAFFARALERDVGKRFQSAREMERAFYALVARPTTSLPPEAMHEQAPRPIAATRQPRAAQAIYDMVARAARSKQRVWVAAIAAAVLLGAVSFVALRRSETHGDASRPTASSTTLGDQVPTSSATQSPAPELPIPTAAGSAAVLETEATPAPPQSAQHRGGLVPAATTTVHRSPSTPPPSTHKPKRDLGY